MAVGWRLLRSFEYWWRVASLSRVSGVELRPPNLMVTQSHLTVQRFSGESLNIKNLTSNVRCFKKALRLKYKPIRGTLLRFR